jgi:hypothetical protein
MAFSLRKYTENEWLKGTDFDDDERVVLTITKIEEHTFESKESKEIRPVLEFKEKFKGVDKKLSLNKTRSTKLSELFGDDSDACIGKRITVYAGDASFGGRAEKTVVIAAYKGRPAPPPALDPDEEFMKDA